MANKETYSKRADVSTPLLVVWKVLYRRMLLVKGHVHCLIGLPAISTLLPINRSIPRQSPVIIWTGENLLQLSNFIHFQSHSTRPSHTSTLHPRA